MLVFNMKRVFAIRGIDKPFTFLRDNGFPASTASLMLNYHRANIGVKMLEKLCVALSCTPNDLFDWRDDGKTALADAHPLNSLRKKVVAKKISDIIKDIPLEKLDGLDAYLESLKEESRPEN